MLNEQIAIDAPREEHEAHAEPRAHEVLEQLERVAASAHFRNSRRYPAMLRFLVDTPMLMLQRLRRWTKLLDHQLYS